MAEKHPTHVRIPTEATSQSTLKIEQIPPAWTFDRPSARFYLAKAMNVAMTKVAA